MTESAYPLFPFQPAGAWHRYRQQDLAELARQNALPILPVYTPVEHSPDLPPDREEQEFAPCLKQAVSATPPDMHFPVLPPLRHLPAQEPGQLFTLPATEAWRILDELVASVAASGFRRMLVFHANPLLSNWLDCGLRDARIATGLTLYRICLENSADDLAGLLRAVYLDSVPGGKA